MRQQIILHKQVSGSWHYCRLSISDAPHCLVEKGRVGFEPDSTETFPMSANHATALQTLAKEYMEQGYGSPHRSEWQVLSLHFNMKPWSGFTSSAAWYEDWKSQYDEPMQELLIRRGHCVPAADTPGQIGDTLVLFKYVLEGEYAAHAVLQLFSNASIVFPFRVYLGDHEQYPQLRSNPLVPQEISDILEGFYSVASTMTAISQEVALQRVTSVMPQVWTDQQPARVSKDKANELRRQLQDVWGFDGGIWTPLGPPSKQETVFLSQWPDALKNQIMHLLTGHNSGPVYRFDFDEGISETPLRDAFRHFAYEGTIFPDNMEWIIYCSHHHTFTFGGPTLIQAVRAFFRDKPEEINKMM
ncbi:MAG: hypothetical protein IT269_12920 [Saprospiraceae bacterium]|nr:hypothetical protein [Saprospiraceae bacterium]